MTVRGGWRITDNATLSLALENLLEGRTALIIAHRLSTVQRVDRIVVMHRGEIREEGTHQELLRKKGLYHRLYELQYRGNGGATR